jgi:hypothetical protein
MADPDQIMKQMKDDARKEENDKREAREYELKVQAAERRLSSRMPFGVGIGGFRDNELTYERHGVGDPRRDQDMINLEVEGVEVSPHGNTRTPSQASVYRSSVRKPVVGRTGRDYRFPSKGRMPAAEVTTPDLSEVRTEVRDESGREIPALDRMAALGEFRDALTKARSELGPMQSYAPEFEEALFRVMREQALRLQIPDAELARSVDELDKLSKAAVLGREGAGVGLPVSRLKGTAADYRRDRD